MGINNCTEPKTKVLKTLANALFSKIAQSLGEAFDLSPRQKAVFECLKGPHAQEFLTVIPIEGLGQCMSAVEYRTILKYRLMIPMYPEDETCPICRKACMDKYGEHAVHCKELPGFKYRHDWVRDVLGDILRRAGISAKKEAPVNFLTDPMEGRSTLRPADLLVFGWAGGKHACVDLTGVSPLVGLKENGFVAGLAARKAESKKVDKHAKACAENQHVFIPFAFDTFGSLAPEAINFLTRVQRVIHSNCSTPRGQGFVFGRLGFAIQKGLAAQLVALVRAPGMAELKISLAKPGLRSDGVSVWEWSGSALDEGDEAAKWFTDFLGKPSRLVRFNEESETRPTDPHYATGFNVKFPDAFPYLLISEVSTMDVRGLVCGLMQIMNQSVTENDKQNRLGLVGWLAFYSG
ncbi:hypothetical protein Hanom_Chr10g00893091 [Helianthus anomalus]